MTLKNAFDRLLPEPTARFEEMLDQVKAWGLEAVELGTGNYPGSAHCNPDELLADTAKLKAFRRAVESRVVKREVEMNKIRVLKPKRDGQVFKMGSAQSIKVLYPEMGARNITLNYGEHPPGAEFRQHVHENSEDVIICITGSGVIRSGDARMPFEAGDIIYVPTGIIHGTINTGSEPLVMFSCQAPPDLGLYTGEKDRDQAS